MRFLILTQYYPPEIGAAQVRLAAMIRELQARGHQVEVVTALPNHPTGRIAPAYRGRFYVREECAGVVIHRAWLYAATGAGLRRMLNYASFTLTALLTVWRARRPDFVFVESPPLFLTVPGYLAARLWRARLILNIADLWPDTIRDLGLMRDGLVLRLAGRLERWSYRRAHFVNAVTRGIEAALTGRKGVPPHKVTYLPNGVDTEGFRPRPADPEILRGLGLQGKKMLVYAGTLGFIHGVQTLLAAAERLAHRTDIAFVIIGDGSERAQLVAQAQAEGLHNVHFLPPAPPEYIARLYSCAVAGISVLRGGHLAEGVRPAKVMPIMASGLPVLYSGSGEGARLVESARAGVVVVPENAQALADAAVFLADHPDQAGELGRNGRAYAEQHLGWPVLVQSWLAQLT